MSVYKQVVLTLVFLMFSFLSCNENVQKRDLDTVKYSVFDIKEIDFGDSYIKYQLEDYEFILNDQETADLQNMGYLEVLDFYDLNIPESYGRVWLQRQQLDEVTMDLETSDLHDAVIKRLKATMVLSNLEVVGTEKEDVTQEKGMPGLLGYGRTFQLNEKNQSIEGEYYYLILTKDDQLISIVFLSDTYNPKDKWFYNLLKSVEWIDK